LFLRAPAFFAGASSNILLKNSNNKSFIVYSSWGLL